MSQLPPDAPTDFAPKPPAAPPPAPPTGPMMAYSYPPVSRRIVIARRAGWLMIALGILILFSGGCFSLLGAALPAMMSQLPPESVESLRQVESQTHMPPQKLMLIMACVLAVVGIFQIVMGTFVRRGKRGIIMTAVIVTAALATIWILNLFAGLAAGNASSMAGGAGILLISVCLFAWQLSWLFQALHASKIGDDPTTPSAVPFAVAGAYQYPPAPPEPSPIGWAYPPPPPSGDQRAAT